MHAKPQHHEHLRPPLVSHGYGSGFASEWAWQVTPTPHAPVARPRSCALIDVHEHDGGRQGLRDYSPLSDDYRSYMQKVQAKSQREEEAMRDEVCLTRTKSSTCESIQSGIRRNRCR